MLAWSWRSLHKAKSSVTSFIKRIQNARFMRQVFWSQANKSELMRYANETLFTSRQEEGSGRKLCGTPNLLSLPLSHCPTCKSPATRPSAAVFPPHSLSLLKASRQECCSVCPRTSITQNESEQLFKDKSRLLQAPAAAAKHHKGNASEREL